VNLDEPDRKNGYLYTLVKKKQIKQEKVGEHQKSKKNYKRIYSNFNIS
jgi:hypothetical protein